MASPCHIRVQCLTVGILLLTLFSAFSPLGQGSTSTPATHQRNSFLFTVNPDRSLAIGWNTTTTFPVPQNVTKLFHAGYSIHSSSNFAQQANGVVQTTTVQYQLPPELFGMYPELDLLNSISLSTTQTDTSVQGSLKISTDIPQANANIAYSADLTRVQINASVQVYFSQLFSGTQLYFLANQLAFQHKWTSTFDNATWISNIKGQIENATFHTVTVTTFGGQIVDIGSGSATVSIKFVAMPSPPYRNLIVMFETLLTGIGFPTPTLGIDQIIQSAFSLVTGESATLTYTSSTRTVVWQSTTNYVNNLDTQLNILKNQYFQMSFAPLKLVGIAIPAELLFLNSTSIAVSNVSTTSDLDLSTGTFSMTLSGLLIKPPIVGTDTNFTMPGLFQTIGTIPALGANITLAGGSNATYQVKVVVPSSAPTPSRTTANSATWANVQDAAELSNVEFQLQHISGFPLAALLSPTGIAIEAVVAAAIIASVFLYTRKRRSALQMPVTPARPAPGLDPSPTPSTR